MKMEEVIKHDNAINLYYLNLIGIVMLRPREVNLDGGDEAASGTATFNTLTYPTASRATRLREPHGFASHFCQAPTKTTPFWRKTAYFGSV
jgi:hypothetical protein